MELNKDLHILIERAWDLHYRINDNIHDDDSITFCRLCSEHGRFCGIAQNSMEKKERLIALRDSLQDVEQMLVFLQGLQSCQEMHYNEALNLLEKSRLLLIDKVKQYQRNGRRLDVIEELNAYFGDGKTAFTWNFKETTEKKKIKNKPKNRISDLLICCITTLFNPGKWHYSAKIAITLIVVSASISSGINFTQTRQEYHKSLREVDSTTGRKREFVLTNSSMPLDVSHGRG